MSRGDDQRFVAGSDADNYFSRNESVYAAMDWSAEPLTRALLARIEHPARILEVGAADGGRLRTLGRHGDELVGLEPSATAISAGRERNGDVDFVQGTHLDIGKLDGPFDVVILGFFVYLVPPAQYFKLISDVDRMLREPGLVALVDFVPDAPTRNAYHHEPGRDIYKSDLSKIIIGHPQYLEVDRSLYHFEDGLDADRSQERIGYSIIRKRRMEDAFTTTG